MGKDFRTVTVYSTYNHCRKTFWCPTYSLCYPHCIEDHSHKFSKNLGSLDPTEMLSCGKGFQEKQQLKKLAYLDRFCMQDISHLKMKLFSNHHILRQFFE